MRRFKTVDELDVEEHVEHKRSGRLPERDEYVAMRRDVLADEGLVEADGLDAVPLAIDAGDDQDRLDVMTVDDHMRRLRRR